MAVVAALKQRVQRVSPKLYQQLRHTRWRMNNRCRVQAFQAALRIPAAEPMAGIVEELRQEGIAIRAPESLLDPATGLFDQVRQWALKRWDEERAARLADPGREEREAGARKGYRNSLAPSIMALDEPVVRLALHPTLLDIANRYMQMHTLLRAIDLW